MHEAESLLGTGSGSVERMEWKEKLLCPSLSCSLEIDAVADINVKDVTTA